MPIDFTKFKVTPRKDRKLYDYTCTKCEDKVTMTHEMPDHCRGHSYSSKRMQRCRGTLMPQGWRWEFPELRGEDSEKASEPGDEEERECDV